MESISPLKNNIANAAHTCSEKREWRELGGQTPAAAGAESQSKGYMRAWGHKRTSIIRGIVMLAVFLSGWVGYAGLPQALAAVSETTTSTSSAKKLVVSKSLQDEVLPPQGVKIPAKWGNLGRELVVSGAIDPAKFRQYYAESGGLTAEESNLLMGKNNRDIVMTLQNSDVLLNLLWALGLANKNVILEKGPMMYPGNGGVQNFASTADWDLSRGNVMNYYSRFNFISLTPSQQALLKKVSLEIYRPCCDNSTYFPDCNHGMALFGLLELMASQGATENQLYSAALSVNSYWFPENYLTLAVYFKKAGKDWKNIDAKEVLGKRYSSGLGNLTISKSLED